VFAGRRLTLQSDPGSRAPCGEWRMLPAGEVLSFGDQSSVDYRGLPPRIIGTQAEKGLAGRLHVSRQAGGMLYGRMDVAELVLEPIVRIDGVGPGRMEDEVDGADRPMQGVGDRKPCLHGGRIEIALTRPARVQRSPTAVTALPRLFLVRR
jgi:hypothetical protein